MAESNSNDKNLPLEKKEYVGILVPTTNKEYLYSQDEVNQVITQMEQLCEILYTKGHDIFIHHTALGETCHFCFLFDSYKKARNRKIAVFAEKSKSELIKQSPNVDWLFEVSYEEMLMFHHEDVMAALAKYYVRYSIFMYTLTYPVKPNNMRQHVCAFLGLPFDTPFVKYVVRSKNRDKIKEKFQELNLTQRRVIYIIPDANTYPGDFVPNSFWKRIVDEAGKYDYQVVFNSTSEVVKGIPYVFFDILDTLEFMKLCGQVLGIRTGLLDVASAFSRLPVIALYPPHHSQIWKDKFPDANREILQEKIDSKYQEHNLSTLFSSRTATDVFFEKEEEIFELVKEKFLSKSAE